MKMLLTSLAIRKTKFSSIRYYFTALTLQNLKWSDDTKCDEGPGMKKPLLHADANAI